MADILLRAKALVTPTRKQAAELDAVAQKVMARTERAARRFEEVRGILLGGSVAKGTWLPESADIDIFVKITPNTSEAVFESVGLRVGREAVRGYKYGKMYAQHPYTEATVEGVKVNVVPCFDVRRGEWKSAADRSQYHVGFVKEKFTAEMKSEVRLLKRFMKVVGVYGAEIEREGFSGYAAEVLVHEHKTFEKVLEYFATLRTGRGEPFVLTDPVDEKRDLGKAISRESVARMALASRSYLKRPRLDFFRRIQRRVREPVKGMAFAIVFSHREMSEDTLWGELKRSLKHIVRHLDAQGFSVVRSAAASDNRTRSAVLILSASERLPDSEIREGPGVELREESAKFLRMNRDRTEMVWVGEDGRLRILQKRKRTELVQSLRDIVDGEVSDLGASADVARSVAKTGRVLSGRALLDAARKEEWLMNGVEEIASDTIGTDTA